MTDIVLRIKGAQVEMVYDERFDLASLGRVSIHRVSQVEPDSDGRWWADMGAVTLGPYLKRSQALSAEREWLESNLL